MSDCESSGYKYVPGDWQGRRWLGNLGVINGYTRVIKLRDPEMLCVYPNEYKLAAFLFKISGSIYQGTYFRAPW